MHEKCSKKLQNFSKKVRKNRKNGLIFRFFDEKMTKNMENSTKNSKVFENFATPPAAHHDPAVITPATTPEQGQPNPVDAAKASAFQIEQAAALDAAKSLLLWQVAEKQEALQDILPTIYAAQDFFDLNRARSAIQRLFSRWKRN